MTSPKFVIITFVGDTLAPSIDDFAESQIGSPNDIHDVFSGQYFFGCEADDPMAAMAFDERLNPLGARIPAIFASDIGHWDVPDFCGVLEEAWELVEHGLLDPEGFRRFTFSNPVRLWAGTNPRFFDGTCIKDRRDRIYIFTRCALPS